MAVRERFTTTIDGQILEDVRILAIKKRCSTNDLMEEAISDLLKKYKEREQAKEQVGDKTEPAKD
jgi:hypothetical protein